MKSLNPQSFARQVPREILQWAQSTHEVLNGQVDMGTPAGAKVPITGGVNDGVYTQFNSGNSNGILVRIAASGVNGTGASYNWAGSNVGVVIKHGLGRQPIGFHVVDADKDVRVYRTAAPNATQITLAPTDNTASVTVYIF